MTPNAAFLNTVVHPCLSTWGDDGLRGIVTPKLLYVRPPADAEEERQIRKPAEARHAPADWITRAQVIAFS